jgi:hypothetical protein
MLKNWTARYVILKSDTLKEFISIMRNKLECNIIVTHEIISTSWVLLLNTAGDETK